jgi:dipeptidyl aminopeptidase/acylaminoacyl peptidase
MEQKVTAEDLFNLRSLSQLNYIDGQLFAVENRISQTDNDYLSDIISLDRKHKIHHWTRGGQNQMPIAVGDNLVFLHNNDVFKMPFTGGISEPLTTDLEVSDLISGRDKQTIFFKVTKRKLPPKFTTQKVPVTRKITSFTNRHDGLGWIDEDSQYQVMRYNVNLKQMNLVWQSNHDFQLVDGDAKYNQLLLIQGTQLTANTHADDTKGVWKLDLNADTKTCLTSSLATGSFNMARFAPDLQHVILVGNDASSPNSTVNDLYIYRTETQELQDLSHDLEVEVAGGLAADFIQNPGRQLEWIDNNQFIFTAIWHGHSQLWHYDGHGLHCVYDDHNQIIDLAMVSEHTVALSISSPNQPNRVITWDWQNSIPKQIYNPNDNFDANHHYADVTTFQTSTTDHKFTLFGWVLKRTGTSQNFPVILYVHGGPQSAYGETFFHEFQTLASRGYAVVYINPRGSTTYGQSFESAGLGRFGQEDYADVMQGLNVALEQFSDLDADNLFIAGGSYGGFMAGWAIGHTHRFNAAIVQRPVSDWHALYGTSDIGVRFCQQELGLDLFDKDGMKIYWNQSPLKYAHQVTTPTRIQHGEYDMRCPVNQSEALFTAIKQTGTDVDYIRYPQSFHGFSRNGLPNLRVQRIVDIYEWFDKYLK